MSIRTQREYEKLRAVGRIVRLTLDQVAAAVRPGITTAELDCIGSRVLADHGARSAPADVYRFPGTLCISVNEEAIHGIPGDRVVRDGDLVKLDLVAEKDGFFADAAVTVEAGTAGEQARALRLCAERAFLHGLRAARAGNRAYHIGAAVDREVRAAGFRVVEGLYGHGVGRAIHEAPSVPNFKDADCRARLTEGLVVTIEPIVSAGTGAARLMPDRWTIRTADDTLAAHYEHTIVITRGEPVLLTAA